MNQPQNSKRSEEAPNNGTISTLVSKTAHERLVEKIRRMRSEKMTWRQVAKALGISLASAYEKGIKNGCIARGARARTIEANRRALRALELRRLGKTYRQIAIELGLDSAPEVGVWSRKKFPRHNRAIEFVRRGEELQRRRHAAGSL